MRRSPYVPKKQHWTYPLDPETIPTEPIGLVEGQVTSAILWILALAWVTLCISFIKYDVSYLNPSNWSYECQWMARGFICAIHSMGFVVSYHTTTKD